MPSSRGTVVCQPTVWPTAESSLGNQTLMEDLGISAKDTMGGATGVSGGTWSQRYGERHRLVRLTQFPLGIRPPKRVRIYFRHDHHLLQWWDRTAKQNLSERVDGDLVAAIARGAADR